VFSSDLLQRRFLHLMMALQLMALQLVMAVLAFQLMALQQVMAVHLMMAAG
jgi:hypothetical protein